MSEMKVTVKMNFTVELKLTELKLSRDKTRNRNEAKD